MQLIRLSYVLPELWFFKNISFNTVDHSILLECLKTGSAFLVLNWTRLLVDFYVSMGDFTLETTEFTCGVPQVSILEPLLLDMYTLPLTLILIKNNISYNIYADDTVTL